MSARNGRILGLALTLSALMAGATAAAAEFKRGIWVDLGTHTWHSAWTLSVINLTNYPLSLVANSVEASGSQRPPFWGNELDGENAIAPYRNVTWKSNTSSATYPHPHWNGTLTFLPQRMDPKWTVTLNFHEYIPSDLSYPIASWVYLTADFNANPLWEQVAPDNSSCSYSPWYNTIYNTMMLSGPDLAVSLYAPYIDDDEHPVADVTLVFRQRFPETPLVVPCLTYWDLYTDNF